MSKRYTQNQVQPSNMPNLTPLQSINLNQPVPHRANQHARAHADDAMFLRFQHALANPHTADAAAEWQELCRLYHARAIGWANRHPLIGVVVVEPAAIAQDALLRMWCYFAEGRGDIRHFPDLRSITKFLMTCTHLATINKCRSTKFL